MTGQGAGTELHGYVQSPVAPDGYVRGGGLWRLQDSDGFGNNSVLAADSGDRAGLPSSVSTLLLFQSNPTWVSTQFPAMLSATGVTVSASVRVLSAAAGGAGIVWAVTPTTGTAVQYYRLVLIPTADGLDTGGTFQLAYVVNGVVTEVGCLMLLVLVVLISYTAFFRFGSDVFWRRTGPCAK